jgi:hypothetical protein
MPGHSHPQDDVASLAYVAGIHDLKDRRQPKAWMAGTSPRLSGLTQCATARDDR